MKTINQVQVLEVMSECAAQVRKEGHDVYSKEEVAKMFESLHNQLMDFEQHEVSGLEEDGQLTEHQLEWVTRNIEESLKKYDWPQVIEPSFNHTHKLELDVDARQIATDLVYNLTEENGHE